MDFQTRIIELNTLWNYQSPFLSEFIFRTKFFEDATLPTIGVGFKDKQLIMVYNPEFMESLSDSELEGVMVHEILHLITLSQQRKATRDAKLWNVATDYTNNEEILKEFTIAKRTLSLPSVGCFLDELREKQGYAGNVIADEIYDFLLENQKDIDIDDNGSGDESKENGSEKQDNGSGSESEGNGGTPSEGSGAGEKQKIRTMDSHKSLDEAENNGEMIGKIKAIVDDALARGYGDISENFKSKLNTLLRPCGINFSKYLRKQIKHFATGTIKEETWERKNRRGFDTMQGKKSFSSSINVFVDVSGSCYSDSVLSVFFTEIDFLTRNFPKINLIQFDTEIKQVNTYKKGMWKSISLVGGGGTDVQCIFDYLKINKLHKLPTLILTDGEFNKNVNFHSVSPLWVIDNTSLPEIGNGREILLPREK